MSKSIAKSYLQAGQVGWVLCIPLMRREVLGLLIEGEGLP